MPAAPDVGDPAGIIFEENADTYCQVVEAGISINTNFGSYDSCLKSHCLYNSNIESVEYYYPDEGVESTTQASTYTRQFNYYNVVLFSKLLTMATTSSKYIVKFLTKRLVLP